jgi:hypothetical protein
MASIKTANANHMFATGLKVNVIRKALIYSGINVSDEKTATCFELKCQLQI